MTEHQKWMVKGGKYKEWMPLEMIPDVKTKAELLTEWQRSCEDLKRMQNDPETPADDLEFAKDICYIFFQNYTKCTGKLKEA